MELEANKVDAQEKYARVFLNSQMIAQLRDALNKMSVTDNCIKFVQEGSDHHVLLIVKDDGGS